MHQTSFNSVRVAIDKYRANFDEPRVLDFGSRSVGGQTLTFRQIFADTPHTYVGVDLVKGKNVDQVVDQPYSLPFDDESFDIIVSGSTVGHIPFVWVTFLELARVLAPGGILVCSSPSLGHEAPAPYDCYRYTPQGYQALGAFAGLMLLEASIDTPPRQKGKKHYDYKKITGHHYWADAIGVFQKTDQAPSGIDEGLRKELKTWANEHADIDQVNQAMAPSEPLKTQMPSVTHGEFDIKIPIYPNIVSPKIQLRIEGGTYETEEAQFMLEHVQPGARVLELGGGLGFISTVLDSKHPDAYTLIEADPRLVPLIHDTHALNGVEGVEVRNCIVTSDPDQLDAGHIKMQIGHEFWGSSIKEKQGSGDYVEVEAVPMSEYVDKMRPTTLLIDIEGAEIDLFHEVDLSSVELVVIELHPSVIGRDGVDLVHDQLDRAGLEVIATTADGSSGGNIVNVYSRPGSSSWPAGLESTKGQSTTAVLKDRVRAKLATSAPARAVRDRFR